MLNTVEATPMAIIRTMGVKGVTLFHLKSLISTVRHKYRLGKQSSKETSEQSKDASCILENTSSSALSPKVPTLDVDCPRTLSSRATRSGSEASADSNGSISEVHRFLLAKAYEIALEQITSNGFSTTEQEVPDMAARAICSPSLLHQLSMSSVNLHSPSCKTSPSSTTAAGIEGQFFYQELAELGNQPC
ncbi:myb-like DNA-binding domain containing protein [Musa troglodytarum]|uniref:Myb-like DNA-binding domain containing protein n=1 Tax=Musa troglodytarum TaxID=320322 RepID=A0A9E7FNV8_9LILI|nr:myb-like DNA-binding domain containing protein [Musa troglodytarum]